MRERGEERRPRVLRSREKRFLRSPAESYVFDYRTRIGGGGFQNIRVTNKRERRNAPACAPKLIQTGRVRVIVSKFTRLYRRRRKTGKGAAKTETVAILRKKRNKKKRRRNEMAVANARARSRSQSLATFESATYHNPPTPSPSLLLLLRNEKVEKRERRWNLMSKEADPDGSTSSSYFAMIKISPRREERYDRRERGRGRSGEVGRQRERERSRGERERDERRCNLHLVGAGRTYGRTSGRRWD